MNIVTLDDRDESSALTEAECQRWTEVAFDVLRAEGLPRNTEVTISFVPEEAMADLNREHMGVDGPTDVLSFPIDLPDRSISPLAHTDDEDDDEGKDIEPLLLGDVVVCMEVAAAQAPSHAGTVDSEIALLVVHGLLHLLGHDHAEPLEARRMMIHEAKHLDRLGLLGPALTEHAAIAARPFRSGFVALCGRPNAGKSTLVNQILHQKVSIVSERPQTTRTQIRGVLTRPDYQMVLVDTPGIHKPRTKLGKHLNDSATGAVSDVDVVVLVVDGTAPIGTGDQFVAKGMPPETIVVVNKTDKAKPADVLAQLTKASGWQFADYFPISALTGDGVEELVEALAELLPEGPLWYGADQVTDVPEAWWVAELVREQLLSRLRDELPHSVATRVTEWRWPYIRVEIIVERDSQKGMVIGKGGLHLKEAGQAVREQLPAGVYLDLHVSVDKDWQRRPHRFAPLLDPDVDPI